MKCPACYNELRPMQVGTLEVDVCHGGCGGVWFDAFELQRVDEKHDLEAEALLRIERDERVVVDPSRKRECPRCAGVKLHRHYFSAKRHVQVDQCPGCGGYWLDAGELEQIREEKAEAAQETPVRRTLSTEFIRYLYRLEIQKRDQP